MLGKRGRRSDVRPAELAVALPGVEYHVGDDGLVRLPIAMALLANNASVVLPPTSRWSRSPPRRQWRARRRQR